MRTRSNTGGSFHSEGSGGRAGDSLYETDVKTLGLMGLDSNGNVQRDPEAGRFAGSRRPMSSDVNRFSTSRFRSYSTNNKEKYAMEEEAAAGRSPYGSGTLTPAAKATAAQLAANNAELARHNAQVQAYIQGSNPSNRPRARTAGLLDSSSPRYWRSSSITSNRPQQFEQPLSGFDWSTDETLDYEVLKNAVTAMQLQSGNTDQDASTRGEQSRAIWLGGVPPSITPSTLKRYFEGFGSVESTRVMTQKGYGFVNFEHVSSATVAKTTWDGQEIFPGFGSTRIAFAKDPSNTGTPGMQDGAVQNGASAGGYPEYGQAASIAPGQFTSARFSSDPGSLPSDLPQLSDIRAELLSISRDFCASSDDELDISGMIDQADQFGHYAPDIPPVAEPSHIRIHDAPRLRDIRKRIDNGSCSSQDIEDIARGMLPEVAELASDYLGNTVVQKLFEYCSQPMKEAMLRKVVPQLAQIGTHKNGTWAAQTIIRTANTPQEQEMIITGLRPYGRASFLDQYGNYVMQGCLRFGSPYNNFLFEIMLGQLWPMAEARFGARAMRACLESQEATKNHQRMLAAAIALYSDHLAINSNGALLLTWYLDTCAFKNRRKVLVPRLIPHMIQLCTHKVAYMTILKLINQKEEPEAREKILRALFFSQGDETLEAVIKDQSCGATFVFKTLTTPFFDDHLRTEALENVRNVLTRIKAPPNQSYKRLMDEVGLTRGTAAEPRMNGASPKRSRSGQHSMNGNTYPSMNIPQMFTPGSMNGGCPPPAKYESFGANGMAGSPYANNQMPSPMAPGQNQQYHQSSPYAQGRYNYGGPPPMGSNGYPTPMSGYGPQSQGRSPQPNYNPGAGSMMPQQGYNPALMAASPGTQWQQQYGPPPSYGMPPQQQMHPPGMMGNGGGGRRGRVGVPDIKN